MKQNFVSGRMNLDADERLLTKGEYREALNIEVVNSESSDVGAVENSLSNKQLTNINLGINVVEIGKFEYEALDKIYWFTKSELGCFLIEWDDRSQTASIVLKDTRPEDNGRVLNLKETHLITGIDLVINEETNKDLLLWTDDNIEPCCINIERAKTYSENGFDAEDIYLIKKQPKNAPSVLPVYSSEDSNYLEEQFLSFAYRYKYLDGEKSAVSSYANYSFNPKKFELDYQTGENLGMVNAFNAVRLSFNSGEKQVTDVEIIVKRSNSINLYLVHSFKKQLEGWSDNQDYNFVFSNNKIYEILEERQYFRTFDNVPRKAKAFTLAENYPIFSNYLEGHNIEQPKGNPIKIDFSLNLKSNDINGTSLNYTLSTNKDEATITFPNTVKFRQGQKIIFDLILNNEDNSGSFNDFVEFIIDTDYDSINDLADSTYFKNFINTVMTLKFLAQYDITVDANWSLDSNTDFEITASTGSSITIKAPVLTFIVDSTPENPNDNPTNTTTELVAFSFSETTEFNYNELKSFSSCKTNRDYEVVLIYKDKWTRQTTGLPSANNTIYIPQRLSLFQNKLIINIENVAPYFATHFKIAVKSQPLAYFTIYANIFYQEGLFRWIKLEGENKDKVKAGDILIVKSDLDGYISDLVKVKVIEIETKVKDFLEGNTAGEGVDIIEQSGIYMKIKASGFNIEYNQNFFQSYPGNISVKRGRPKVRLGNSGSLGGFLNEDTNAFEDYEITSGSRISVYFRNHESDGYNKLFEKDFIVQSKYSNFQKWWEVEVVDLGDQEDYFNIEFIRNEDNSLWLSVEGDESGARFERSKLDCKIDIVLSEGILVFETQPKQADLNTFYETEQTFEIIDGLHQGNFQNQTSSTGFASIELDFSNCYVQGNGVESYRVKDSLLGNYLNIDLKPTSTTVEPYKEIRRFADATYGQPYVESSGFNGINEFNLSTANFKELDKKYGSIQRMYTRDTNIVVWQEDKVSKVLFGKDVINTANGIPVIGSISEVLGQQIPYLGENGIGLNPESLAWDSYSFYYINSRRGTPIRLSNDGTTEINYGLVSYFRDLCVNNPTSYKLGAFDPYHKKYVIYSKDEQIKTLNLFCGNTLFKRLSEPFTYEFNLNYLTGELVVNYNVSIGIADILASYEGVDYAVSGATGLGNLTIPRNTVNQEKVVVIVTPKSSIVEIEITNNCPIGIPLKVTSIVFTDKNSINNTIVNRYNWGNSGNYSDFHVFENFIVSKFSTETGIEGVGKFPNRNTNVNIQSLKESVNTQIFNSENGNKLGYLITDEDYQESDISSILSESIFLTTTETQLGFGSFLNQADFTFSRPNSNHNLYLIWDYRSPEISEDVTFYNTMQLRNFTRNNCAVGEEGSIVSYTVAANTYQSIVSQEDADAQAVLFIDENGQAFANANGSCTAPETFNNTAQSQSFTKNDCSEGQGSDIAYTVSAGAYQSTISQSDADAQAINDINSNGQSFANANGDCNSQPNCVNQVVVFQICNSNSAIDDNYDIYLNDIKIGAVDLNSNSRVGSLFIGSTNTNLTLSDGSSDFVCLSSGMANYFFNPSILKRENIIRMERTQTNNNGNAGSVGVRHYTISGNSLVEPAVLNNFSFRNGDNIFNFLFEECGVYVPPTFNNVEQSQTFTRNNCENSGQGSNVTYTVAANTYQSTVSQADANAQATNDVNSNGQAFANANGSCTSSQVFNNVQQSQAFTRNNCSEGQGSDVFYMVSAGTYQSTVSQADANAQATADINANGQNFANANGTCSPTVSSFTMSNNGTSNSADACNLLGETIRFKTGANSSVPENGEVIYNNSNATITFNGNNIWFKSGIYIFRVSTVGVIFEIGICGGLE